MSESGAEKVVEASPDRKRRARGKGDVPISQEANTAAAFLGFLVALGACVPFAETFATELRLFSLHPEDASEGLLFGPLTGRVLRSSLAFVLPLTLIPGIAVLIALGAQQSIVFAPSRIKPDLNKISPVKGAGKKFGPQALLEFGKSSIKIILIATVGGGVLAHEASRLALAFEGAPSALPSLLLRELMIFFGLAFGIAALFAVIDIPIVQAQREKRLRTTAQEAKDEQREGEGDPELKAQRRKRAEKIALNRMLTDVKKADVIVVNPTHYAVALSWDRAGESLPICVAKGTDEVALKLRSVAHAAGVPIRDDPPNARSLYATVDTGEPIKPQHFAAVAAAIRFADRVRKARG